jgi:hypothetical protein
VHVVCLWCLWCACGACGFYHHRPKIVWFVCNITKMLFLASVLFSTGRSERGDGFVTIPLPSFDFNENGQRSVMSEASSAAATTTQGINCIGLWLPKPNKYK